MKESFLHYIWQTAQFDHTDLKTVSGHSISIHKRGSAHHDGGPDFQNALIAIDGEKWAGQVEIHINSSDWFKHNHHLDSTYDGTILHVVYTYDADVTRTNGTIIPCLALNIRISKSLITTYDALTNNSHKIPCEMVLSKVASQTKLLTIEARAIDRLEAKSIPIFQKLQTCQNDWQEVLYQMISRAFGMRVNKLPFELLSKQVPTRLLSKYTNIEYVTEALLFGCAGFLNPQLKDDYGKHLYQEYAFLSKKHSLDTIPIEHWKFLRLRPTNFPTIRIGQLAAMIPSQQSLFATVLEHMRYDSLKPIFDCQPNPYWSNHYRFDVESKPRKKSIGQGLYHNILINAIVPVVYCYALHRNDLPLQDRCLTLMTEIAPEQNSITHYFQKQGFDLDSALHSQGVLHMHEKFCTFKDCLNCQIGHQILTQP